MLFFAGIQFIRAQETEKKNIKRQVYATWGWNKDYFSTSTLHFHDPSANYDFKLFKVKAKDRPNYNSILSGFNDFAIPQYSYRIGYYFKNKPMRGLEFNFDHTKYVMNDSQYVHMEGHIGESQFNQDTLINANFLKFEHTNGANFFLINYFTSYNLFERKNFSIAAFGKAGAGVVVPKTDVTLFGTRLDNKFHLAGWIVGTEGDMRFTFFRHVYLEGGLKVSYADYVNVLVIGDGKANHSFATFEWLWMFGFQFGI